MIERPICKRFRRLSSFAVVGAVLLSGDHAQAQATGQVVSQGGTVSSTDIYQGLKDLLLSPPEPKLNFFASPIFTREEYDDFTENGLFWESMIPSVRSA